jgi:hypothetical protein
MERLKVELLGRDEVELLGRDEFELRGGIASQKYWHGKRGWEKIEHNCFFVPL